MKQHTIALAILCFTNYLSAQTLSPNNLQDFIKEDSPAGKVLIQTVLKNISFVSASALQIKPQKIQLNLKQQLEATKALCPLLQTEVVVQLEGERSNNLKALLQWKAKNAFYAHQYLVERSIGDTLNFESVKTIWPSEKAATKEKYETDDINEYKQVSYYRIKLLLLSGSIIFSNIAEVHNNASQLFKVYPNPARKTVTIDGRGMHQTITSISIIDANGKAVVKQIKPMQNQLMDISKLVNGSYWIRVELADNTVGNAKFIKQ